MELDLSILDGTVEQVTAALPGLTAEQLDALLAAEQSGKDRKGVIDAIEVAKTSAEISGDDVHDSAESPAEDEPAAEEPNPQEPADIAPAEEFDPSGAPMQTTDFPLDHPALDANPRAGTSSVDNRIDFNDPTLDGRAAVERALGFSTGE